MVLIQVTNNPGDEYYVEAKSTESVDEVATRVARIHNLRNRVKRLAGGMRELALYGPMRPEEQRGLSVEQVRHLVEQKGEGDINTTDADPHGMRVGIPVEEKLAETLRSAAADVERLVASTNSIGTRTAINEEKVQAAIEICRGAVMMAYPMGLPEYDTVHMALNDTEIIEGTHLARDYFDPKTCVLWFAGKKMTRDQPLSKFSGSTEKVSIKVKITSERVTTAPAREPAIDAETQKKLMAQWYKRQEELKRLEEADEDSYLNSEWANPHAYKAAAQGIGQIRFR